MNLIANPTVGIKKEKTKICNKCKTEKKLRDFHKRAATPAGVVPECKTCSHIRAKKYRNKNKTKVRERDRNHYKNNTEKIKKRKKIYRENNKEKIANQKKAYLKKNKEAVAKRKKTYYNKNKKKIAERTKIYYKNNKEKINICVRAWQKRKRETDPMYKLSKNISNLIWYSLKSGKGGRKWSVLVGYTVNKLKKHLEKQFTEGMTWANYGKDGWTLDHKIPVSVFNFTKPEHIDFKRCWALKNLQPMWAEDNLEKRAKLNKHFQPSLLVG